jgi:secreted trypsin-like serine protease
MRQSVAVGLLVSSLLLLSSPAHAKPRSGRIVGGQEATPGAWPWQVYLEIGLGQDSGQCGGSMIAPDWILTAAHCVVDDQDKPLPPGQVSGFAGIHDLNVTQGAQPLQVVQVIVHEAYDSDTDDNDIALLRLAVPLSFDDKTRAVSLVPPDVGPLAGQSAWVTGWGDTSDGGSSSDVLLEVEVPIISNSDCKAWYDSSQGFGSFITENMLCAGTMEGGKDSCQGDSGGPLVVDRTGNQSWELAGVVSWGTECAGVEQPGVYVRVSRYGAWIESSTGGIGATPTPTVPAATATPTVPPATATPTATAAPATATPTPRPPCDDCNDDDLDGVPNCWDKCPDTGSGSFVNPDGCPGSFVPMSGSSAGLVILLACVAGLQATVGRRRRMRP